MCYRREKKTAFSFEDMETFIEYKIKKLTQLTYKYPNLLKEIF